MSDEVDAFKQVLAVLDEIGLLPNVILVGGWAQHLYRRYFDDPPELSALRTLDVDLLFRRPPAIKTTIDLDRAFSTIGLRRAFNLDASTKYVSREIEVEFLIPDRGKGDEKPYSIEKLSISAQSLRLLDMLTVMPIAVTYAGFTVHVPDPARFCLHKLLVSERRQLKTKQEKDLETALELASLFMKNPEWCSKLSACFRELTERQRGIILRLLSLQKHPAAALLAQNYQSRESE